MGLTVPVFIKKVRVDLHEKVRSEHKLACDQGTRHSTVGLRQARA